MHDHVEAAVLLEHVRGDRRRGVGVGDVDRERGASELSDDLTELALLGGDVDADHERAVAREHLGDRAADAA